MLFVLRTLVAFGLILVVVGMMLAWVVLENRPWVRSNPQLAATDFERVQKLLKEHDPRQMKTGAIRTVTLNERDLTLVTNYFLNYYYGTGVAKVELQGERLVLKASLQVPDDGWAYFLNLRANWVQDGSSLRIARVDAGRLPVPGWLAEGLVRTYLRLQGHQAIADVIQKLGIADARLRVTYRWQPKLLDIVRRRMVSQADANRLELFHAELVRLADKHTGGKRALMGSFLKQLFEFAARRLGEDPVADNRAIFMVLGAYVNGRGLEDLVPDARTWGVPKRLTLTLSGRKDLARHFLTSAALAVTGGGFFSDTMGVYKEMADAQRGSGFSFSDLAADRAGTRFSELATKSSVSAKRLWRVFSGQVRESDFMPSVTNLPEFMSASAFHARFGTIGSPAYNRVVQDIEERISALSLFR